MWYMSTCGGCTVAGEEGLLFLFTLVLYVFCRHEISGNFSLFTTGIFFPYLYSFIHSCLHSYIRTHIHKYIPICEWLCMHIYIYIQACEPMVRFLIALRHRGKLSTPPGTIGLIMPMTMVRLVPYCSQNMLRVHRISIFSAPTNQWYVYIYIYIWWTRTIAAKFNDIYLRVSVRKKEIKRERECVCVCVCVLTESELWANVYSL